jgi:2'-5' RNA ligase
MKRLFAAIKIIPDENLLRKYYNLKKELKHERIKWVDPENMHLTLKFFGELPEEKVADINKVIRPFAAQVAPFTIRLQHTGVFGSRYNPRVIWYGIEDGSRLKNLGNELLEELDTAGFENDRQHFVPHFTVGRIKELTSKDHFQRSIATYKDAFFQESEVKEIHLFESILRREGPKYLTQEKYPLGTDFN